jgi:HAD superfamily phosphoserine phosphatase-like hydrolase
VVVSDFDGTIVSQDLPELVLSHFGEEGWEEYDRLVLGGELGLEECIRKQYQMIRASSKRQILVLVRDHSDIRPGFKEMAKLCQKRGIELVIVSAGIDFIIDYVLKLHGLQRFKVICPTTEFTSEGILVEYPEELSDAGYKDFKDALIAGYEQRGYQVTFIGDGTSDLSPMIRADKVFVIEGSELEEECHKRNLSCVPIEDFRPVVEYLRSL